MPLIELGTGKYKVRGLEVIDGTGSPAGYTLEGVGFISIKIATDPAAFDAEYQKRIAAIERRQAELQDRIDSQASPPPASR